MLVQEQKNNAILVADAGVGKTGIVEGLAQHLATSYAPPKHWTHDDTGNAARS